MGTARDDEARLTTLGPLFVSAFLLFGLNNATTSAMPEYLSVLGSGPCLAGLQNSLFVLAAVLLRFVLGPLSDRLGSKPMLILGAAGFCLPCALIPLFDNTVAAISLRLLQAVGLAAFHPNVAHYITTRSSPEEGPHRIGLSRFVSTASLMIVPAALFPLIDSGGYGAFFAALALAALAGLLLLLPLRSDAPDPSAQNRAGKAVRARPGVPRDLMPAIGLPLLLAAAYSVILVFGPLFMKSALPRQNGGLLLTFVSMGGLAGSLAASRMVERWGAPRSVLALVLAFGGGLAMLAGSAWGIVAAFAGSLAAGIGYFGATAALISEVGARAPRETAGMMFSAQQNCLDLGIVAGSFVAGTLLQVGISLEVAFLGAAALLVASGFAWFMLCRSRASTESLDI